MMQPKCEAIQALFTRVAARYDLLNRALTFGIDVSWRNRAIAQLDTPHKVLDLATGTADLAIALAKKFPSAEITGADLTPAMLEIAARKIEAAGLEKQISLREANAHSLPFEDESFDLVTCAFGFRNFPDKAAALREAKRVLRPGGTLLVLELFRNRYKLLAKTTSLWLGMLTPVLAPSTKPDYRYLRASIENTLSADEFIRLAGSIGFELTKRQFFLPSCSCTKFRA